MSRNAYLRKMASQLPVIWKRDVKGRPLFDERGEQITVDHFKELKAIQKDVRETMRRQRANDARTNHEELEAFAAYSTGVWKAHKLRRMRIIKKAILIATVVLWTIIIAIYVWIK